MKKLLWMVCALMPGLLAAQSFKEKINKEFAFEKKPATLIIMNINGSVKVEGYNGDKVMVEVDRQIYGKTEARLEKGKLDLQLGVINRADTIILHIEGMCNRFGKEYRRGNNNSKRYGGWGYDWNMNCCGNSRCDVDYDWEMDFTIKVPMGTNVLASTVNKGDIQLQNIEGYALAENINGSISLKNISGGTWASTINGDVDVDYAKNPNTECRFYSLNGDINAYFVKGLAANVAFESFNGDLFTNVVNLESLPSELKKAEKGKGVSFKLGGTRFKLGNGGVFLDFETFNGNAYIKEK